MIDEYLRDELSMLTASINKLLNGTGQGKHYLIVANDNPAAFYTAGALSGSDLYLKLSIINGNKGQDLPGEWFEGGSSCRVFESIKDFFHSSPHPDLNDLTVLYFTPTKGPDEKDAAGFLNEIAAVIEPQNVRPRKPVMVIFSLMQGKYAVNRPDIALGENEFEAVYKRSSSRCAGKRQLLMEEECWKHQDFLDIRVIRCSGVFGPLINSEAINGINRLVDRMISTNTLEYSPSDRQTDIGTCYIRDAVTAVFHVLVRGESGQAYNLTSYCKSLFNIKFSLFDLAAEDKVKLVEEREQEKPFPAGCDSIKLAASKIKLLGWKPALNLLKGLQKTYQFAAGQEWNPYQIAVYQGKLKQIQDLELQLLKEVDRICSKHGIQYFLVCGSALGAVRHSGFIPWDDDLDIGMLREDHERFRKVVAKELDQAYVFQSHTSDKFCHYIFDKIRIKGTRFATKYSYTHSRDQGIFLDIFVYDKTANNRLMQKLHILYLQLLKSIIKKRWKVEQVKQKHSFSTLVKYSFVSIFPFSFYHWLFEMGLKAFRHHRASNYLIDGTGMNLGKGAFKRDLMKEFTRIKFEDMLAPVPRKQEAYLTQWFGEDYLTPPPISKRLGHTIVELDLGLYLLSASKTQKEQENCQGRTIS